MWLPDASAVVLNDDWPEAFTVTFDANTVRCLLRTSPFPEGVPVADVVVEVNVTDWPK